MAVRLCEVGAHKIFHGASILWLAGMVMGDVGAYKIFHGASFTVVGWHGYGRGSGPIGYSMEPALLWLADTGMGVTGAIRYYTEPALLWLAGAVMGEVGAHKTFHSASIIVICWHGLWPSS